MKHAECQVNRFIGPYAEVFTLSCCPQKNNGIANKTLAAWMAVISPKTAAGPCLLIQSAAYSERSMPMVLRTTKMMTRASPVSYAVSTAGF